MNSGFRHAGLFLESGNLKTTTYLLDEAIGFEVDDNGDLKFDWFNKEPGELLPMLR
jgi:hypothetical protein